MKTEEIDAMQFGADLDALIAERVMNYRPTTSNGYPYWEDEESERLFHKAWFQPSTNMGDAWEVVEKLIAQGYSIGPHYSADPECAQNPWTCPVYHRNRQPNNPEVAHFVVYGFANTAPLAICRAALKTVEVKSED